MSGYLERLTREVLRPAEGVRPVVGSIFSPPLSQVETLPREEYSVPADGAPTMPGPENTTRANQLLRPTQVQPLLASAQVSQPSPITTHFNVDPPQTSESTPQAVSSEANTRPAMSGPVTPYKDSSTQRGHSDVAPPSQERNAERAPLQQPMTSLPRSFQTSQNTSGRPASPEESPAPLLSASDLVALNRAMEQKLPSSEPKLLPPQSSGDGQDISATLPRKTRNAATVPGNAGARAAAGRAAQEPDEIHIHIGRIEVSATTPAPQKPAPPMQRKSLDLGEYLKRSSGRS